jgi:signal transduction histidine kinase
MQFSGSDRNGRLLIAGAAAAIAAVMVLVLIAGFRLATQIRASVGALQRTSVLQTYPAVISQQLTALRQRLGTLEYTGHVHRELARTVRNFNRRLAGVERRNLDPTAVRHAESLWRNYTPVLAPVLAFSGEPYDDTDTGSSLSASGRKYYDEVRQAGIFAQGNAPVLHSELAAVSAALQTRTSAAAARLRTLLLAGVLAVLLLALAAAYLQLSRARQQRAAREAQDQTRDILKTVREGFFLLDADYRIGAVWSEALTHLFGRNDFKGLAFEELLRDKVPADTLATAVKYIKLLWGERARENLMKSINPLGQLEVSMDNGRGGREARFLQFDFHRVMGPKGVKHVLCAVGDITSSVLLARELQEAQENAHSQLDMMIGMLHADPLQVSAFLDSAAAGLKHVNTIMKEPARTDAEFRKKLAGLSRELHSIKGEASALSLMSVAERVHHLEDMVAELKAKSNLTGNDFLPVVLKLDELLAHLRGIREMTARLVSLKEGPAGAGTTSLPQLRIGDAQETQAARPGRASADLGALLEQLAGKLASDHGKQFRLTLTGLSDVPAGYLDTVKDCAIQMLRNAAVHGIEPCETRRTAAKPEIGEVRLEFRRLDPGYELVFQDDGAGLSPEALKEAAVRKNVITTEEAAALDNRAALALIFRPGFSTRDSVSMDAGRGTGMDLVARSVYGLGGKIGVSTNPGRFTRFKITLPAASAASAVA